MLGDYGPIRKVQYRGTCKNIKQRFTQEEKQPPNRSIFPLPIPERATRKRIFAIPLGRVPSRLPGSPQALPFDPVLAALGNLTTRLPGYRSRSDRPDASRVIARDFGVARTISGPIRDLFMPKAADRYCAVSMLMWQGNYSDSIPIQTHLSASLGRGSCERTRSWKREKRNQFSEGAVAGTPLLSDDKDVIGMNSTHSRIIGEWRVDTSLVWNAAHDCRDDSVYTELYLFAPRQLPS